MKNNPLTQAVFELAQTTQALSDQEMGLEWAWRFHAEGLRFALIGSYHELRDLAVTLRRPQSSAEHAAGQYHAAFRDLEAILLGVSDEQLDQPPAENEWPLRDVLGHIIRAERTFLVLCQTAVQQQRAGQPPTRLERAALAKAVGKDDAFKAALNSPELASIFAFYNKLHDTVLAELSVLDEVEVQAQSPWWEGEPLPVLFRLHRFDAHLRQHTIQAEKTLAAIGHPTTEARRLLRLVYNALAEVEAQQIGRTAPAPEAAQLAETIRRRTAEVQKIIG